MSGIAAGGNSADGQVFKGCGRVAGFTISRWNGGPYGTCVSLLQPPEVMYSYTSENKASISQKRAANKKAKAIAEGKPVPAKKPKTRFPTAEESKAYRAMADYDFGYDDDYYEDDDDDFGRVDVRTVWSCGCMASDRPAGGVIMQEGVGVELPGRLGRVREYGGGEAEFVQTRSGRLLVAKSRSARRASFRSRFHEYTDLTNAQFQV